MRKVFRSVWTRSAIVSLTIMAWLAAINHCALANVGTNSVPADAAKSCHSDQGSDCPLPTPGMQMFCGKELTSPVPPGLDAPFTQFHAFKAAWVPGRIFRWVAAPVRVPVFYEHAPPGGDSIFQIFLKSSLGAHAPPVGGIGVPPLV